MVQLAERMAPLDTQYFAGLDRKIAELKAGGADVIRLDVGDPDMPPAEHIIAALSRSAAAPGHHGYQSNRGTPALRTAWVEMYRRLYQVELDPETELTPLMGSKVGIFHTIMALAGLGDVVLVPDPGYLAYETSAIIAQAEAYPLPLLPENDFLPDLAAIPEAVARRAKLLWLNYPNNPTGAVAPLEFFEAAVAFARRYDLLLCHDAAYSQVTFDGYRAPSPLQVPGAKEVSLELNTLSKSYNMAGWRVGAAVGNAAAVKALFSLKTYVDSGHFLPVMDAATAALTGDQSWLQARNAVYQRRRDRLMAGLRSMSFSPCLPQASLYIWCPLPQGWASAAFCEALLSEAHVSLTPGVVFGRCGEGYARISLSVADERIEEALHRMQVWMAG
ncbi:MAG: aminotransferase class I/II-fold pyridoxal phosphate-dependent enzyme [Anaerolineales bacterium]|nr:aminotransferase class I/II-fold pyridoxal phosphate-dependent enzyme [Anaerolineales bacterium]